MKTATILPQAYLGIVQEDKYNMVLAHLVGKDGFERYTEFYKAVGWNPTKYLLMDTGLIEGDARPVDELVEKAILLNADEMILNDVFMDKDGTLRESHDALEYVIEHLPGIRRMAVPQGKTLEEWIDCAKEMLTWPIHTLGIPKVLCSFGGMHARLNVLSEIQEELAASGVEVHLLGCWESPLEVKVIENYIAQGKILPVRGVDSAIAFAYARAGLRISEDERPEGSIDFGDIDTEVDLLRYNVTMWREECGDFGKNIADTKIHRIY